MTIKMKKINLKNTFLKILAISLFSSVAHAKSNCTYFSFEGWKECFIEEKLGGHASPKAKEFLENANLNEKVIKLDNKQPEKKIHFDRYHQIIGFKSKIKEGKTFLKQNRTLLNEISAKYNVEPEVIVALIGIESSFGKRQGNFNIIDSLATLSYDGRRKTLFENQLKAAIEMGEENNLTYDEFVGSWAGAMGKCQFMPTSYKAYAVDYDNDGKKDIWNSNADAFASAANYLNLHGWKNGDSKVAALSQKTQNKYSQSQNYNKNCKKERKPCKTSDGFHLISLKKNDIIDLDYKVGNNFNVLMKWNRSYFFSLSVLMIADGIKNS